MVNRRMKKVVKQNNKSQPNIKGRYYFSVFCILFMGIFSLIVRASYVQVIDADSLSSEADKRSLRNKVIIPLRGSILDRDNNVLSASTLMHTVSIDPKLILNKNILQDAERWQALAKILDMPYQKLLDLINKSPNSQFVYLARQITPSAANTVKELNLAGVYIKAEQRRFYPEAEKTAHLIGYTNLDSVGIEGIEKSFDSLLLGKDGVRTIRKDRRGNEIEGISSIDEIHANDVVLSISKNLQAIAYEEINKAVRENKAVSGTAVLLDIKTGEILAMANAPSYNPNSKTRLNPNQADRIRNRAVTDVFEPGSTIKPFVVLAALQNKVVHENSVLDTRPFKANGYTIKDVAPREKLSITGILQKSSNVGVSKLALAMHQDVLINTYTLAGFGQATDAGLIGAQKGKLTIKNKWSDIERATFAYGYGVNTTPLQLARAYAVLGSFGVQKPLSITKVDGAVTGERVFPENETRKVVKMMEAVATEGGGGIQAAVKGYRVAVKTGTAKKIEKGKYVDKYIAYTAGVAPASNPRYSLVIVLNEPNNGKYYGGAVAAPVFSAVMSKVLKENNIPLDSPHIDNSKKIVYVNK